MSLCVSIVLTKSSSLGTRIALVMLSICNYYTKSQFLSCHFSCKPVLFSIRVAHSVDLDQVAMSEAC